MSLAPWREAIQSPRFALLDFWLVVIGGGLLCLLPGLWVWGLLIALIPWGLRIVSGVPPFRRTGFDWWVAGFVVTAGAGYWASYDSSIASVKFLLVIASVLLYYALSSQPQENLVWVSVVLFCVGFGVSVYFLLTHDFLESPRKLEVVNTVGRWVMQFRPSLPWAPIHPNYVAGIAAITTLFIFYPSRRIRSTTSGKFLHLIIIAGLGVVLSVMFMATSRGVLMAVVTALGVWILWKILRSDRIKPRLRSDAVFPPLVLALLFAVVIILYLGPATLSGSVSNASRYGGGSRAEVFARSAYLIADFPFTGGGLGAYPGLYSQYILGIPHFYLPNGHNVFLDVFIEQGVPGGLVFLILYVSAIWQAARAVTTLESSGMRLFNWLVLSSLIVAFVHGMVDDYLYNGKGTILSFVPLGLASISPSPKTQDTREPLSLKGYR